LLTFVLDSYDFTRIANNDNALWVLTMVLINAVMAITKMLSHQLLMALKMAQLVSNIAQTRLFQDMGSPIDVDIFMVIRKLGKYTQHQVAQGKIGVNSTTLVILEKLS